jgi:DNA-binding HxlR family transcriptional regulator
MESAKITSRSRRSTSAAGTSSAERPDRDPAQPRSVPARRRYEDACGAAHALDLIGERWALLVMRELMFGPRRFSDLKAALPGISANVLTQRLEGLEASGIVERRRLPPPASVQVYGLTRWGMDAEPIFQSLGRWAVRSPSHDPSLPLSPVSLMLSLRTMFDPSLARGMRMTVGFTFGEDVFVARVGQGTLQAARVAVEETAKADVRFAGATQAVAAAVHGKVPLPILESAGDLVLTGDRKAAEQFVTFFAFPADEPA